MLAIPRKIGEHFRESVNWIAAAGVFNVDPFLPPIK